MLDILKALWGAVSDKHTLAVASLSHVTIVIVVGVFCFYTPIYNDETPYQLLHRHAKQWTVFNRDSADNNASMIGLLDKKLEERILFEDLRRQYRDHEAKLYQLVDDEGNFKSDFKRQMWERRDNEIRKELDRLKENLDDTNSLLSQGMLYAKRDR